MSGKWNRFKYVNGKLVPRHKHEPNKNYTTIGKDFDPDLAYAHYDYPPWEDNPNEKQLPKPKHDEIVIDEVWPI